MICFRWLTFFDGANIYPPAADLKNVMPNRLFGMQNGFFLYPEAPASGLVP